MRRASYLSPITFAALLLACPLFAFAQGETFDNCEDWTAAVCGTIVDDDFESLVDFNGEPVDDVGFFGSLPTPQDLAWGQLSQEGNQPNSLVYLEYENIGYVIFDVRSSDFALDPSLGALEGICCTYVVANEDEGDIVWNAYDGDVLVATQTLPTVAIVGDFETAEQGTFGWVNTDGLNVTRFEFATESDRNTGIVGNIQIAFGDGCEPATPEETITETIGDVFELLAEGSIADKVASQTIQALNKGLDKLEQGNVSNAITHFEKAIRKLLKGVSKGDISFEDAAVLIEQIESAIDALEA